MRQLIFGLLAIAAVSALALSAGCSSALAQNPSGDDDDKRRTISVSGMGEVRVKPDLAVAVLGVSKQSPNLTEAKKASDAAIAKVTAALRSAGIAEDNIRTVRYQIFRVQQNPQAGIKESHWNVVHMLQVRTKTPDSIASVVDAAVAAGATDVENVGFTVDEMAPHRASARELAVNAAKEKAQHLARLLGVSVGEVISVSESGDFQPMPQMANMRFDMAEGMGGGSGIMGGQVEVSTTVHVVFGIR